MCLLLAVASPAQGQSRDAPEASQSAPSPPASSTTGGATFSGTHFGGYGAVSETPALVLGVLADALVIAIGISMQYDESGVLSPATGEPSTDTIGFQLELAVAYMFYNVHPFAFGPEIGYGASLAPGDPFAFQRVAFGIGFWYAVFPAPVAIGFAWDARIIFRSDGPTSFDLFSPALRFAFAIS